jgi:hypothetical protein
VLKKKRESISQYSKKERKKKDKATENRIQKLL